MKTKQNEKLAREIAAQAAPKIAEKILDAAVDMAIKQLVADGTFETLVKDALAKSGVGKKEE